MESRSRKAFCITATRSPSGSPGQLHRGRAPSPRASNLPASPHPEFGLEESPAIQRQPEKRPGRHVRHHHVTWGRTLHLSLWSAAPLSDLQIFLQQKPVGLYSTGQTGRLSHVVKEDPASTVLPDPDKLPAIAPQDEDAARSRGRCLRSAQVIARFRPDRLPSL